MKINVLGWYDKNNCGDEAFKPAMQWLFEGQELIHTTEEILPNADLYVLGGGDVLKPFYTQLLKDKPYFALGVGLGYEDELNNLKAKETFFRNKKDVTLAKNLGFEAEYTPDITFCLQSNIRQKSESKRKRLGVVLTDCINANYTTDFNLGKLKESHYSEYFKWDLAETLTYFRQWYDIVFIPFSKEHHSYDHKMHLDVVNRMKETKNVELVGKPLPVFETIELISSLDLVITQKFHGMLFSVIAGVPFINIGITRKTQMFCHEEGISYLTVPPFSFQKERIIDQVKFVEEEKEQIEARLKGIVDEKRFRLNKVKEHIQKNWLK